MDNKILNRVSLRYRAVFLDISRADIDLQSQATIPVTAFLARLAENGFCVSEELLHALNTVSADRLAEITECINEIMGVKLNWAPLVKGWNVPTDETLADHINTWFVNMLGPGFGFRGRTLPCGHLIPEGTFPINRYNGCPFCGKPMETSNNVYKGQGSKLKELRLFTTEDMRQVFTSLLSSATPLDATQKESLEILLQVFPVPDTVDITMKETAMLVIRSLVDQDRADEATKLLKTPADILRFLWYEKTGFLQIIEPRTLVSHSWKLYKHNWFALMLEECGRFGFPFLEAAQAHVGGGDRSDDRAVSMKENLMLKYDRKDCQRAASWLNAVPLTAVQAAENMNPKRGMWARMIHALRLGDYSRRKGFEHLAQILDVFYKQDYSTWQGSVDLARMENDADRMLSLLKERPGLFARCLFATMLRFGSEKVLAAFEEIADKLPARLLLSLGNAAEAYFNPDEVRIVRLLTGETRKIEPNKLLLLYDEDTRKAMAVAVNNLYRSSMSRRFAAQETESKTIYIDPSLYNIPLSVGDRSATIQDTSCALMGTRFPVEGDAIRLFLQWGKGMCAQHIDMDLSCRIILQPGHFVEECAYYHLTCVGARHSGDIQHIPNWVGTAEYIELSLPELEEAEAKYAFFICNAYSGGALSPNLVVGWMDSRYPMTVSEKTGVAYDPSCVQHLVRISEGNLSKGLVFGVLDVPKREIIWLEMPFTSQTMRGANGASIEALLHKLEKKISIGELLDIKARAQNLAVVLNDGEADEVYNYEWALNPSEVTKLLTATGRVP